VLNTAANQAAANAAAAQNSNDSFITADQKTVTYRAKVPKDATPEQ